ncbi:bifunctional UDP-sugar hydrolase/5'-nucleotidase [Shewanella sp. OPT22]|nr:bifunctional UDP-sugar hydrolase/5'-nucleotidase [Shewanella sp. OPT22]
MSTKVIKVLPVVLAVMILFGCGGSSHNKSKPQPIVDNMSQACADLGDKCVRFTVLHTNDNHGRFWENSDGEGGMAARKSLVDSIKAEVEKSGSSVLLVSGGDVNTGIPESDVQDAEPDFVGMNMIGYDAMALGNHEFDNSPDVLADQQKIAHFPLLSANIYRADSESGSDDLVRVFKPYKIFTFNGLKVALVGMTTPDTKTIGNPLYVGDYTFTDPGAEMKKVIADLKNDKKADVVMAVTHLGYYPDGKHGSNGPGDVTMARVQDKGALAAIFGGHSQTVVCTNKQDNYQPGDDCVPDEQNGTYIMQAGEWGKYVGRADFEYYDNALHLFHYKLVPVNLKDDSGNIVGNQITPDPTAEAILRQYQNQGATDLNVPIAKINAKLEGDRAVVRDQQTNLGHFIAAAQQDSQQAQFGIMNSGGVRDSIASGDVSTRSVLTVQPFANEVYKVEMSGSDLTRYLSGVATKQVGSGGYAQFHNIKMDVNCTPNDPDQAVTVNEVNGTAFDANANYVFTIPSFNAAGGDGYPKLVGDENAFPDATVITEGHLIDWEVLSNFFKSEAGAPSNTIDVSAYTPVDSDIVYSNTEDESGHGCKVSTN